MRRLLLISSLLMINTTCFATANFTSATGTLVIPEVLVDGTAAYDSVTLELDRDNGTFIIQNSNLKNTLFLENPLQTTIVDDGGLKIEFYGCVRPKPDQITCMEKVVSIDQDIVIHVFGDMNNTSSFFDSMQREFPPVKDSLDREYSPSSLTDGFNRRYSPSSISARDKTDISLINFPLAEGIPVEIRYVFNNIDPNVKSINKFRPMIFNDTTKGFSIANYGQFKPN